MKKSKQRELGQDLECEPSLKIWILSVSDERSQSLNLRVLRRKRVARVEIPRDRLSGRLRFDANLKVLIAKERKAYPKCLFCETVVQKLVLSVEEFKKKISHPLARGKGGRRTLNLKRGKVWVCRGGPHYNRRAG